MSTLPYRAIVDARFRMLLQYRAAAIAGVWTQLFFGFVLIMVYEAFYRSSAAAVQPMTLAQVVSYVWMCQALFAMVPWNADPDIRLMVRNGAVAYELLRPVDLYALWFARAIAQRTAPTLLRALPMALIVIFVLPVVGLEEWTLRPPAAGAGVAFAMSLLAALLLSCAISTLLNVSLLLTISGDGVVMMAATVISFCSGMIVPLPLFPDWLQGVLGWLPFAGVVDLPFRVYNGDIPAGELALVLVRQLGWTVVLIVIGRVMLARFTRRIVVQGG
jgi:ABC-2 type transport system permease protein